MPYVASQCMRLRLTVGTIITTSLTTIVGLIPLSLSSPLWLPLGVTIISGLLFATVLSLFIVPCLYLLFTHDGLHAAEADAG